MITMSEEDEAALRKAILGRGRIVINYDPPPASNVVEFRPKPREASPFTRAAVLPLAPKLKEKDDLRFMLEALTELNEREAALPTLLFIRDLLIVAVNTNVKAKNNTWRKFAAIAEIVGSSLRKYG